MGDAGSGSSSVGIKMLRVITGVGMATILYKSLAASQQLLMARTLGASQAADAFFVAQTVPVLLAGLLSNAVATSTVYLLREHKDRGTLMGLCWMVSGASVTLGGMLWLLRGSIVRALAPGASGALAGDAAALETMLLPVLILQPVGGFLTGLLLSSRRVLAPPFSMCLMYACGLTGLWLTEARGGAGRLAAGLAIGAGLQVAALAAVAGRELWTWRPKTDWRAARELLMQLLPALGSNAISTLFLITDRSFASTFGAGHVASISYVYSLVTMPTQIAVNTVVGVCLPGWVGAHKDPRAFADSVTRALALLAAIVLPLAICMTLGAGPIARLTLGSTRFSAPQVEATASLLAAFAPGVALFAAKDALSAAALAQGRGGLAFGIGLAGVAVAMALKWLLAPALGMHAAAVGTGAALGLCSVVLLVLLSNRELPARFWMHGKQALLAAIPACGFGWLTAQFDSAAGSWIVPAVAGLCYAAAWWWIRGAPSRLPLLKGRW